MKIRRAGPEDAATITAIRASAWRAAYAGLVPPAVLDAMDPAAEAPAWAAWLATSRWPAAGILLAETDDGVCGFAGFGPAEGEPGVAVLHTCYLLPEVWRRGYGSQLTAAVIEALVAAGYREALLWVLDGNRRGRRFYEATGWFADGGIGSEPAGDATLRTVRYRRALRDPQRAGGGT